MASADPQPALVVWLCRQTLRPCNTFRHKFNVEMQPLIHHISDNIEVGRSQQGWRCPLTCSPSRVRHQTPTCWAPAESLGCRASLQSCLIVLPLEYLENSCPVLKLAFNNWFLSTSELNTAQSIGSKVDLEGQIAEWCLDSLINSDGWL